MYYKRNYALSIVSDLIFIFFKPLILLNPRLSSPSRFNVALFPYVPVFSFFFSTVYYSQPPHVVFVFVFQLVL